MWDVGRGTRKTGKGEAVIILPFSQAAVAGANLRLRS